MGNGVKDSDHASKGLGLKDMETPLDDLVLGVNKSRCDDGWDEQLFDDQRDDDQREECGALWPGKKGDKPLNRRLGLSSDTSGEEKPKSIFRVI